MGASIILNPVTAPDRSVIESMQLTGPRYTSYPTADRFISTFSESDYRRIATKRFRPSRRRALSLYVHLPFCNTVCYYCACNKIITNNRRHAEKYLDYLEKEIKLQAPLFASTTRIEQLHFGGGTPTFLDDSQLTRLMAMINRDFAFAPDTVGEFSIEIDPRKVAPKTIRLLRTLGFNRMSIGVQDFDPAVQAAVNRIQSEAETQQVVDAARAVRFKSISMDLIYGLPKQTMASFDQTLDKVLAMRPDRLSVYHYAHLPQMFKTQRQIVDAELPDSAVKQDIFSNAVERLTAAGYVYIGMDHFALPDDELAVAQRNGTLHRNFQGYSTHDNIDMLALGVSAIGKIGDSYSQNVRELDAYYAKLDADQLPVFRGIELGEDDALRRNIIQRLMCDFHLSFAEITATADAFRDYFHHEMQDLARMAQQGLLTLSPEDLSVTAKGRYLVRNIAMVFDRYLRDASNAHAYSTTR